MNDPLHALYIAGFTIFCGMVPFSLFMGLTLSEAKCWIDTPLSSQTWLIVFAVDWLLCFGIIAGIQAPKLLTRDTFSSASAIAWYWSGLLIWVFDMAWVATASYQIAMFGLEDCTGGTIIAALVCLCLKLLWTPATLLFVFTATR